LNQRFQELEQAVGRARNAFGNLLALEDRSIQHLLQQVTALSPQNTLNRGYAVVRTATGVVVSDPTKVPAGTKLKIRVAQGDLAATTD